MTQRTPFVIGFVMAPLMLAMMHRPIMEGSLTVSAGLIGFVLAHVAVVIAVGVALALVPAIRKRALAHRPSLRHMGAMLAGMVVAAGLSHAVMHSGWV